MTKFTHTIIVIQNHEYGIYSYHTVRSIIMSIRIDFFNG